MITEDENSKNFIESAIKDAEKYYNCKRDELQWKVEKDGSFHIRKKINAIAN